MRRRRLPGAGRGTRTAGPRAADELLRMLPDGVIVAGDDGRIERTNDAADALLGWPAGSLVGRPLRVIVPERLWETHQEGFDRFHGHPAEQAEGRALRVPALRADGSEVDVELRLARLGGGGVAASLRPFIRATDTARLAAGLLPVLAERVGRGESTPAVVQAVGEGLDWDASALWALDPAGAHLRCEAFWASSGGTGGRLRAASSGTLLPPGIGIPGTVWESGEPVWVTELATRPDFMRGEAARADGFRSGFAFPVVARGRFLGVLELFARSSRQRDETLLAAMASVGEMLGQYLDRARAEDDRRELVEKLQAERARLAAVVQRMPAAVVILDVASRLVTLANDEAAALLGKPSAADAEGRSLFRIRGRDGSTTDLAELVLPPGRTPERLILPELELILPDGTPALVSVQANPVADDRGRASSIVVTLQNVTAGSSRC